MLALAGVPDEGVEVGGVRGGEEDALLREEVAVYDEGGVGGAARYVAADVEAEGFGVDGLEEGLVEEGAG